MISVRYVPVLLALSITACAPHIRYDGATDFTSDSSRPSIVAVGSEGGTVHVAWEEGNTLGYANAQMGHFLSVQPSPMPGVQIGSEVPDYAVSLAAAGSQVYIAAEGRHPANDDALFVASSNAGTSFGSVQTLSDTSRRAASVRVAGYGDNVHVVWIEEFKADITSPTRTIAYIASSTDRGQNFGTAVNLSGEMDIGSNVRVVAWGDNVNVAWCRPQPGGGADLYMKRSEDAGTNFTMQQLIDDNVALCGNNHLYRVQNKVYAIWLGEHTVSDENNVFVNVSLDGGAAFQGTVNVSNTPDRSTQGVLAMVGDYVYVTWEQEVDTSSGTRSDIFVRRSTNNGRTFGTTQNLSIGNSDDYSSVPAITANGKYVHILWEDAASSDNDIFYRRSNDWGETYSPFMLLPDRIHNPLGEAFVGAVSRGRSLYAVWTRQASSGNRDLYYYSKRTCPVMPNDSGIFRCLACCN